MVPFGLCRSCLVVPIKKIDGFQKLTWIRHEIGISELFNFFKEIFKNIKKDSFHTFFIFLRHFYSLCSLAPWYAFQTPFDWPIRFHCFRDQSPFDMVNRPWKQKSSRLVRGFLEKIGLFVHFFDTFLLTFVQIQTSLI